MRAFIQFAFASLALTACASEAPAGSASPLGNWVAEDIMGAGVIDNLQTTLMLTNSNVTGFGGCNRYNGSAAIDGMSLSLGPVAATRMACVVEAANNQETRFFEALTHVTGWRMENDLLHLTDAGGMTVVRLSRIDG